MSLNFLVQEDIQSQPPKTLHDVVQQSRDTIGLINEFREPTTAPDPKNQKHISSSGLFSIFTVMLVVVVIFFFYTRLKKE